MNDKVWNFFTYHISWFLLCLIAGFFSWLLLGSIVSLGYWQWVAVSFVVIGWVRAGIILQSIWDSLQMGFKLRVDKTRPL